MPIRLRSRRTTASITTTSPGWTGRRYRTRSIPAKNGLPLAVLRLRQDHDGADLRDRFGEDRRRQHRQLPVAVREIALVERDVLDADDPLVGFELGDPIDEQERIAVRQNPLDRGVVERQRQGIHERCQYNRKTPHECPSRDLRSSQRREHRREQEMLTTLFDLGRQVTAVLDFDELLAQIPELIARLIEFDAFAVYLLDERRGELLTAYPVGYPDSDRADAR